MSVDPKSVDGAVSPVQGGEIECKTVKLKMNDSSYKIELGQTKWRTNSVNKILKQRLHNRAKY